MAVKRFTSFLQLLHLFVRFLGLTGLFAAVVGGFLWLILEKERLGMIAAIAGGAAVLLALLFEIKPLVQGMASRRGAFGFNVFFQIALAVAVVVIVNLASFYHYRRFDWTRDLAFTLPDEVKAELAKLRTTTEIILLQQYVSFGQSAENKQDKYDLAAQRKVVEKVKDLAELFQEFGGRFRVQVLDIQDDDYLDKLRVISEKSKELAEAIKQAPENSIFFFYKSGEQSRIQRLSFSDIYHLDKEASMKAADPRIIPLVAVSTVGLMAAPLGDGPCLAALALHPQRLEERGNLVLKYQGIAGVTRKIWKIEEPRPRVAMAIFHPLLGLQNREHPMFTMNGAKKLLDSYGFDSVDVLTKKLSAQGRPINEPSALLYNEGRYKQLEDMLALIDRAIRLAEVDKRQAAKLHHVWKSSTLVELNKEYAYFIFPNGRQGVGPRGEAAKLRKAGVLFKMIDVDEEDIRNETLRYKLDMEEIDDLQEARRTKRARLLKEKSTLHPERLDEKERELDVEKKMRDALEDVNLLIIPRVTVVNAPTGFVIDNRFHSLDDAQLRAIRAHIREGNPVLFLLGPTNSPDDPPKRDARDESLEGGERDRDPLEKMLDELGFRLPRQTILYDLEADEYQEQKVGVLLSDKEVEVPGLILDDATAIRPYKKTRDPLYLLRTRLTAEGAATLVAGLAATNFSSRFSAATAWLHPGLRTDRAPRALAPHPIRTSLKVTSRMAGNKESYEVRVRHPRPVYYMPTRMEPEGAAGLVGSVTLPGFAGCLQSLGVWQRHATRQQVDENAVILLTSKECWNDNHPFLTEGGDVPRYHPPKEDDPKRGTVEEMHRGPFPIGAAVEVFAPGSWYEKEEDRPKKVRVAVIGSGGLFMGATLPPLKQKMFLDVVNWLLKRAELLARDEQTWQYPRACTYQRKRNDCGSSWDTGCRCCSSFSGWPCG
jgi:hypothetical protein